MGSLLFLESHRSIGPALTSKGLALWENGLEAANRSEFYTVR
jgi:hypothetical protein